MPGLFETIPTDLTRLILVRHGRTNHNASGRIQGRTEIPLDEHGREQAHRAGAWLRDRYAIDVLYTSPLTRAHETATIIGSYIGLEPQCNHDIIEFDFGIVSDCNLDELAQRYPALYQELQVWLNVGWDSPMTRPRIPGMEDETDLAARIVAFWEHIQQAHRGKTVAAVTHGGVIKGMFTLIAGGDLRRHTPFWADNASVSIIDFYRGGGAICLFNERHTLEGAPPPSRYVIL